MKKTRLVIFIMCLSLIASVLSGCDSADNVTPVGSEPVTPNAAVTDADSPAPPEGTPESPVESKPVEAPPTDEVMAPLISFPLDESITLTAWTMWIPGIQTYLENPEDNITYAELKNRTNVNIDLQLASSPAVVDTEFQLMLASGDYTDLINGFENYYTASLDDAIEQELLVDMSQYLNDYMPNYSALLENRDIAEQVYTPEGKISTAYLIYDPDTALPSIEGMCIRQDWLDEQNLTAPETFQELHDVLKAFSTAYNTDSPLYVGKSGMLDALFWYYDDIPYMEFYVDDNYNVNYAYLNSENRVYLDTMNQYYEDNLIYHDYVTLADDMLSQNAILEDTHGVFCTMVDFIDSFNYLDIDDNFQIVAMASPVQQSGDRIVKRAEDIIYANPVQGYSVSTDCKYPEIACAWLDYCYSDETALLLNYGIEGTTFEYDDNGTPHFTELVANNPDGIPAIYAKFMYVTVTGTFLYDNTKDYNEYCDEALEAMDIWTANIDYYDTDIPTIDDLEDYLTADESSQLSSFISEIVSYQDETQAKIITGSTELTDAFMQDYETTVNALNVGSVIKIYETALERYLD